MSLWIRYNTAQQNIQFLLERKYNELLKIENEIDNEISNIEKLKLDIHYINERNYYFSFKRKSNNRKIKEIEKEIEIKSNKLKINNKIRRDLKNEIISINYAKHHNPVQFDESYYNKTTWDIIQSYKDAIMKKERKRERAMERKMERAMEMERKMRKEMEKEKKREKERKREIEILKLLLLTSRILNYDIRSMIISKFPKYP